MSAGGMSQSTAAAIGSKVKQKMKTNVRRMEMKAASQMGKSVVFAAILACLIVAGTGSAFAADPVLRNDNHTIVNGKCCVSFGESVSVVEPAPLQSVIVTWSTGYQINVHDSYFAGLSVNGSACNTALGPRTIPDIYVYDNSFLTATFQWVVLPSDGLLFRGTNTFELCGGGENYTSDSINIGQNTLFVQLVK
jgi:hypothetical protein